LANALIPSLVAPFLTSISPQRALNGGKRCLPVGVLYTSSEPPATPINASPYYDKVEALIGVAGGSEKVFACWCVVHLFGAAGYANQRFDFVIVRSEFLVSEGPILAPAVLHALRLEVKRAKTITAPTPKVRAAAHGAQARPREC